MGVDARQMRLQQAVQAEIARGGRMQSATPYSAVIVYGQPVNHLLHFLIGVFTVGLWWIVWLILAITGGEKRKMVSVDESGQVVVQDVP